MQTRKTKGKKEIKKISKVRKIARSAVSGRTSGYALSGKEVFTSKKAGRTETPEKITPTKKTKGK